MRISRIRVKNFRAIEDQAVELNQYNCLVGANGAGKSTVLAALNVFFREGANSTFDTLNLREEDFHLRNTAIPIELTVTFVGLDHSAQVDFAEYFRHGELVISSIATYDPVQRIAPVRQVGERMVLEAFGGFFKELNDGVLVPRLREIYAEILKVFPDLPIATTKVAMATALRDFEARHPEACTLTRSEDRFYGVSGGENRLSKYVQWVYIPAVKDASEEQLESRHSALSRLLGRAVRNKVSFDEGIRDIQDRARTAYRALLDRNQAALDQISNSLASKLAQWSHPSASLKVQWQEDPRKAIAVEAPVAGITASEGPFEGQLSRFGHGFQRSFLLALLSEISVSDVTDPTLVLGCEEPELYQHPPQARHLADVLMRLAKSGSQVILTTHSPHFISGYSFEDVRLILRAEGSSASTVRALSFAEFAQSLSVAKGQPPMSPIGTMAKVHQVLRPNLGEMFFSQRLVFVEGFEDIAYIHTWLALTDRWDLYRARGIQPVAVNGKSNLLTPLLIARGFGIPSFLIFDCDGHCKEVHRAQHEQDNLALMTAVKCCSPSSFPHAILWEDGFVCWPEQFANSIEAAVDVGTWKLAHEHALREGGHAAGLSKNDLYIGAKLAYLFEAGVRPAVLETLCEKLLSFATE